MFTGIIRCPSAVSAAKHHSGGLELRVKRRAAFGPLRAGDSIAVNGVCLTVKAKSAKEIVFDVVPETLARSTLGALRKGEPVNLEASLRLGDSLGGHLVYGHVDATAKILRRQPEGQGYRLWLRSPGRLKRFIVEKGYVALDGVSLTIAAVGGGRFAVVLVPETIKRTTLGRKTTGRSLNMEVDPIARYVAEQLANRFNDGDQPKGNAT